MSKKNKLSTRRNQHEFDLKREKEENKKKEKKQMKRKSAMQVDKGSGIKKKSKGFLMGKGKKAKLLLRQELKKSGAEKMDVDKKRKKK